MSEKSGGTPTVVFMMAMFAGMFARQGFQGMKGLPTQTRDATTMYQELDSRGSAMGLEDTGQGGPQTARLTQDPCLTGAVPVQIQTILDAMKTGLYQGGGLLTGVQDPTSFEMHMKMVVEDQDPGSGVEHFDVKTVIQHIFDAQRLPDDVQVSIIADQADRDLGGTDFGSQLAIVDMMPESPLTRFGS